MGVCPPRGHGRDHPPRGVAFTAGVASGGGGRGSPGRVGARLGGRHCRGHVPGPPVWFFCLTPPPPLPPQHRLPDTAARSPPPHLSLLRNNSPTSSWVPRRASCPQGAACAETSGLVTRLPGQCEPPRLTFQFWFLAFALAASLGRVASRLELWRLPLPVPRLHRYRHLLFRKQSSLVEVRARPPGLKSGPCHRPAVQPQPVA